ncbi:hypothetical protein [Paraburkholderia bonniea]|uniref:hypothetical protein n=1 Tax=Paraburkholderia bonniea TaxID=2152891 RepID=UPI00129152E4|nr:hypothetical protein [Paraburkholderia bonniea]
MESGSTVINLSDGCISAIPTPLPKHVTTIIANNNSLLSLPDDLYESNITYLSVSGNAIKKWPSIWPRGLKELIFDRNPVGHLPDNLPNSVERISGIDCGIVRGLDRYPEKLINLTLSRNKIEVFEIKNIKNLRNLDISLNPLKTCLVDSPESLEMLYMGDTNIVRFNADFSKCINLRGIFLEGCSNLTEFVVVFPDKEVVIDFSGTGITEEYFKSPGHEKLKVDNWGFTS